MVATYPEYANFGKNKKKVRKKCNLLEKLKYPKMHLSKLSNEIQTNLPQINLKKIRPFIRRIFLNNSIQLHCQSPNNPRKLPNLLTNSHSQPPDENTL